MVEYVPLGGKGTHAVSQQEERRAWVFRAGDAAEASHIIDQQLETAGAEISELRAGADAVRP